MGGILNLVAVAGSDRGVAAAAVAVSIESLKAVFAWRDRLEMAVSCHVSVGDPTANSLQCPFSLYPLSLSLSVPPLPPVPAVSGEPPPSGCGAAFIGAPGKTHIPQQQIWGELAAEEYERFRSL